MAQIYDRGSVWELSIFPEIEQAIEIIDEPDKGYRATLGLDPSTQRHVVSSVVYSKEMYSIDDVMAKIKALRDCERCDTLDKDRLQLESINIPNQMPQVSDRSLQQPQGLEHLPPTMAHGQITAVPNQPQPVPVNTPLSQQVGPDIKDMFGNLVLDAYLTDAGKYFLGLMLNDQAMIESAYPKDPQEVPNFMGNMIDFMSGKQDFMRSPDEARDFLSVMQTQDGGAGATRKPNIKKNLASSTGNIIIY